MHAGPATRETLDWLLELKARENTPTLTDSLSLLSSIRHTPRSTAAQA